MRKHWATQTLIRYKEEVLICSLNGLLFAAFLLIWRFGLGYEFHWESIEPIEAPSLFSRSFYSAIVFLTAGAFLYAIGFYLHLHTLCVKLLNDWKLYRGIKAAVWLFLILLTYWGVGKAADILNNAVSFLYNLLNLVLYLIPPLGVTLALVSIFFLYRRRTEIIADMDTD